MILSLPQLFFNPPAIGYVIDTGQNACPRAQLYQLSGKQPGNDLSFFCPKLILLTYDSLTFAKCSHNELSIFIAYP